MSKIFNVSLDYFFDDEKDYGNKKTFLHGMMSLKELYKIGFGPSSSHSMGPEKACRIFLERFPDAFASPEELTEEKKNYINRELEYEKKEKENEL